jgi:uncharacterized membrane protein
MLLNKFMPSWFSHAVWAAALYGLHQIFTKLAAERIKPISNSNTAND